MKIKSNPEFKIGDKVTMLSHYGDGIIKATVDSIIYKFLRKKFVYKVSLKSNSHFNSFQNITYEAEGYELIKIEDEKEKKEDVDIILKIGDKVRMKGQPDLKGYVISERYIACIINNKSYYSYGIKLDSGFNIELEDYKIEKIVEEYSLLEILNLLEKSDYPDGTILNSIDKKHRFKVYNNERGVHLVDDKASALVEFKNEFIKAKYFKPTMVKNIYRNEILAKFNCEEFKIVD